MILFLLCLLALPDGQVHASTDALRSEEVTVRYEKGLQDIAREVIRIFPSTKDDLKRTLDLEADFRPEVVLVGEKDVFRRMAGSDIIIAFAVPGRNLIVMDASKVYDKPFTLGTTLKHELCHLILHEDIGNGDLPRWFDEGVCQWSTGGIAELVGAEDDKALAGAVVSNRLLRLEEIRRFPPDTKSLILAYEESKSVVEYIVNEYGLKHLSGTIRSLEKGVPIGVALRENLRVDLHGLENGWMAHLRRRYTWFTYVSNNLYTLLFLFAALITVYGFMRLLKKRKEYTDEEGEG